MRVRRRESDKQEDKRFDSGLNVLFLAAFPLMMWFFQGSAVLLVTAIVQLALFSFALRLISQGQKLHRDYDASQVARRPLFPRKVAGSVLIGLMVLVLAGHHFVSLGIPAALGLLATGLSIAAFGPDPWKDKGLDNPEVIARIETEEMIVGTETALRRLSDRIADLGDADLRRRTEAACGMATRLLRTLASDLTLTGKLAKPTEKFAEILGTEVTRLEEAWEGEQYLFARRRYVAKLDVLAESFETRMRKLGGRRLGDAFDLEADLLLDRMRRDSAA
jgi:hypothetical protein